MSDQFTRDISPKSNQDREKITGHAVFSPSQLPRIMLCPASVTESTYAPISEPSSYAKRGTFLHDIVPQAWENGREWLKKSQIKLNLTLDEYNWIIDCIEYIEMIMKAHSDHTDIMFENSVDLKSWGLPEVWGTSDVIILDHQLNTADIIDWKFGSGVQVYVEDNEQCLAYAAGSLKYPSPFNTVTMHIVQPPLSHFDKYTLTYHELQQWVFDVLTPGIELANLDNPTYNPGEKQCRFCPAGMTCRARHTSVQKGAKEIFKTYSNLSQVSTKELAAALRYADEYTRYIKDIRIFAMNELQHGRPFPGYKLVSGRATRKWGSSESTISSWLKNHSAIRDDKLYTKKLISPAQAEKLDKPLKKDKDFQALINKPPGNPQLVEESDKRDAVKPSKDAATAFGGIDES